MSQIDPWLRGVRISAYSPAHGFNGMIAQPEQRSATTFCHEAHQPVYADNIDPSLENMFSPPNTLNAANSQSQFLGYEINTNTEARSHARVDESFIEPGFRVTLNDERDFPSESAASPLDVSPIRDDYRRLSSGLYLDDAQNFLSPSSPPVSSRRVAATEERQGAEVRPDSIQEALPQSLIVRLPVTLPANYGQPADHTAPQRKKRKVWGHGKKTVKNSFYGDTGDKERRPRARVIPSILMANDQVSPEPWSPGNGIREPVPPLKPNGLYFSSLAEARQSVGKPNWMPPQDDDTVPSTIDEQAEWVLRLRTAMEDMSKYEDGTSAKIRLRWLDRDWVKGQERKEDDVLTNPYYPPHWMEEKCWEIVNMCTRLHQIGPSTISSRNPGFLEMSFAYKDLTFEQRMNIMIDCALRCKNRVGELIGGGMIEKYLVTAPELVKQSMTNRDNNLRRQVFINEGKPEVDDSKKKKKGKKLKKSNLAEQATVEDQAEGADMQASPGRAFPESGEQEVATHAQDHIVLDDALSVGSDIAFTNHGNFVASHSSPPFRKGKRKASAAETEGGLNKRKRVLGSKAKTPEGRSLRGHKV
ncbi:hypothetical protein CC86DRAFT_423977 [Ophiobolus disseminans]|uniref:Uncharacterized protein n=1 Tax=Ophiobolus disseminans TaxID=1469910 RepID=A0A6A6ZQ13_9PLEO|nr:hypothetical protein CC86DRAFT_423977 [Ophiobolus disseminans]